MGNSKSRSKNSSKNREPSENEKRFNDIVNLYKMFVKYKVFDISRNELRGVDKQFQITEELRRWVNPYNIFTIGFVTNPSANAHELIEDFINALLVTPEEIENAEQNLADDPIYTDRNNQENSLQDDEITNVTGPEEANTCSGLIKNTTPVYNERADQKKENYVVYSTKASNLEFQKYFLKSHGLDQELVDFRPIDNENPNMLDFTVVVTPEHPSTNHETINKKIIKSSHFRILLFNLSYPTISDTMKSIIQDKELTRNRSKNLCIMQNENDQNLPDHAIWRKSGDFYIKLGQINSNFPNQKYDYFLNIHPEHASQHNDKEKAKIFDTMDEHYRSNLSTICRNIEKYLELLRQFLECKQEVKVRVFKRMTKPVLVTFKERCKLTKLDENLKYTNMAIDQLESEHCLSSNNFAFGEPVLKPEVIDMLRNFYSEENRKLSTHPKGLWKACEASDYSLQEQIEMIKKCERVFCKFKEKSLTLSSDIMYSKTLRKTKSETCIKRVGKKKLFGNTNLSSIEEPVPEPRNSLPGDNVYSRTLKLESLKRGDTFDRHATVKYDSKN